MELFACFVDSAKSMKKCLGNTCDASVNKASSEVADTRGIR
jgi:hypothetical protein